VITGASQGMGAALVEAYRGLDYGVVAMARSVLTSNDRQILVTPGDGSEREAYLEGAPANDARFIAVFAHALEHAGGYAPEEARRVAGTLLPDVLSYDPMRPASFPSNGRTLTDDAADAFLAVLTNGKVTGDKVGPHIDLLAEFPIWGRRTASLCRTKQLRLSQPSFARHPGAWALHEGGRYEPT